jgi:hypothetical protein
MASLCARVAVLFPLAALGGVFVSDPRHAIDCWRSPPTRAIPLSACDEVSSAGAVWVAERPETRIREISTSYGRPRDRVPPAAYWPSAAYWSDIAIGPNGDRRKGSEFGGVAERLKAPVLKTGEAKASAGSNPAPSANYSAENS